MVLKSGIIIPFQFKDDKRLLMIGGPSEDRDISIWDFKNVVQTAFGVLNCEFRNKKIGFAIPEYMLLHYLDQRRDLTNFVIEIEQKNGAINNDEYAASTNFNNSYEKPRSGTIYIKSRSSDNEGTNYDQNQQLNPKKSSGTLFLNPRSSPLCNNSMQAKPAYMRSKKTNINPISISHVASRPGKSISQREKKIKKSRKREQKTSYEQKDIYLSFLESNHLMSTTKAWNEEVKPLWKALTIMLNDTDGPQKTTSEWIKTFDTWRYTTFYKFRYNSSITGTAALEPKNFKPISEQEERAYLLWIRNPATTPKEYREGGSTSSNFLKDSDNKVSEPHFETYHVDEPIMSNLKIEVQTDSSSLSDNDLPSTSIKTEENDEVDYEQTENYLYLPESPEQDYENQNLRITNSPIRSSDDEEWETKRMRVSNHENSEQRE